MTTGEKVYTCLQNTFSCRSCINGCCSKFEVMATKAEADSIMAMKLDNVPEKFEDCFAPGPYGEFIVRKRNGNCVFAHGRRCAIHEKYGLAAKPLSCRIFPFHLQRWTDGKWSAELRFICPAVGAQGGLSAAEMTGEIARCIELLGTRRKVNDAVYSAAVPAPLVRVRFIHEAYKRILYDDVLPWKVRLYAAVRVLDFHRDRSNGPVLMQADEKFAGEAGKFVKKAAIQLAAEVAKGKPDALIRTEFCNLLCGYLRDDDPGDHSCVTRLRNAWHQIRTVCGFADFSVLNGRAPAVPAGTLFAELRNVTFSAEAVKAFELFFFSKLESMHFCGTRFHGFSYEDGLRHLLLSAPVCFALAAAFAIGEGQTCAGGDEMRKAVYLADFTFGRSPFFQTRIARHWIRHLTEFTRYAGLLNMVLFQKLPSGKSGSQKA